MARTVYFPLKDRIFSTERPYTIRRIVPKLTDGIFPQTVSFTSMDQLFSQKDRILYTVYTVYIQFRDRKFSARTVYFTCDPIANARKLLESYTSFFT